MSDLLVQINQVLDDVFPDCALEATVDDRSIVTLSGTCPTWSRLVKVGQTVAAIKGVRNVVSDMDVPGLDIPKKDYTPYIEAGEKIGVIDTADIVVVGLGITGCAIARELSKYNVNIVAVDMGEDVATGASKANNGGVHMSGKVKVGTLKAKMNVRGNQLYDQWAEDLKFHLIRPGSMNMVESTEPEYMDGIYDIFTTAVINGDQDPVLVDGARAQQIEPKLLEHNVKPVAAVFVPSQGKVHPYEVCVKLIENAAINGVKVMLNCTVGKVLTEDGRITGVVTEKGIIKTRYLINAAGVYADEIAEMSGDRCFTIHPRRGTLVIVDKSKQPMYDVITKHYIPDLEDRAKDVASKGGAMDYTPSRNILLGPSAVEVPDKESVETTTEEFNYAFGRNENPDVSKADVIRIFSGVRPADFKEDFIIEASDRVQGLIIAGAIQSPGIGAAPAVAERVEKILLEDAQKQGFPIARKEDWEPTLPAKIVFGELSYEEQDALIKEHPEYGNVICRCETITEGEILDAIRSPVVPTTIDAIKRRTRAGMGRCQGGFCQPRVLEILARELGCEWVDVNLKGKGSNVLKEKNRPF